MKFLLLLIPLLLFADPPKLLLLQTYKDQNISGWVMSEKLDGIRAYWNGEILLSRSGRVIHAPQWFLKDYPPFAIDGELWSKRKDFENISSIVRDKHPGDGWKQIKHYIFDVPNAHGDLHERLASLEHYLREHNTKSIKVLEQKRIDTKEEVFHYLHELEREGAEGLVVRDPKSAYVFGRTTKALKVKSFHDAECRVVEKIEGKGKYKGLLGSLLCELPNGIRFKIGSGFTQQERENPPTVGDIVTFKYKEFTKYHKPRFPVFLRVRYRKEEL